MHNQQTVLLHEGVTDRDVVGLKDQQQSLIAMSYRIRNCAEHNAGLKQREASRSRLTKQHWRDISTHI